MLPKYDFVINYITGKNNERTDVFSKRYQNVPEIGDDKLEYKMAQLLKPKMLNFEIKPENFIKIQPVAAGKNGVQFQPAKVESQPVATGKNGVEFQPISVEEPENELENLWATAKNNEDVYQSMVGVIKKGKRTLFTFLILKFFIGDCSLDNNETVAVRTQNSAQLLIKLRYWISILIKLRNYQTGLNCV